MPTFIVYRLGSGATGLDNKNAADAEGICAWLGATGWVSSGTHVSAYRVTTPEAFSSFAPYTMYSGGRMEPDTEPNVGKRQAPLGGAWFSFPARGHWSAQHLKTVPVDALRAEFKPAGKMVPMAQRLQILHRLFGLNESMNETLGRTLTLYRLGSGGTSLANKNAADLGGLAQVLRERGQFGKYKGDTISIFQVMVEEPFGQYRSYDGGSSYGAVPYQPYDRVGCKTSENGESWGGGKGSWYSFPASAEGKSWKLVSVKGSVPLSKVEIRGPGGFPLSIPDILANLRSAGISEMQERGGATKTFTVYRWGAGNTGLDNKNAGDAWGVIRFIEESLKAGTGGGTHVSAYSISAEVPFAGYLRYRDGDAQGPFGVATERVGRWDKGDSVWYSFPKGGAWKATHIKTVPILTFKQAVFKPVQRSIAAQADALHKLFGTHEEKLRESADSANPTTVEYAIQYVLKGKSPAVAAKLTKGKLHGQSNLFYGGRTVDIDQGELEAAIWDRIASFAIEGIPKMKPGMEHYTLGGTAFHFQLETQKLKDQLRREVIKKLGHNPFHDKPTESMTTADQLIERVLQGASFDEAIS